MKIVEKTCCMATNDVGRVQPGTSVKFLAPFHSSHGKAGLPFMVCRAPDGYRPDHDSFGQKVPVVNVRTGLISYVCAGRDVYVYKDAEVVLTRGCCS